jgi:small subunit ribosomal protein S7
MTKETKVATAGVASKNPATKSKDVKAKKAKAIKISYTDELQVKFVNCIMKNGKKTIAQNILQDAFNEITRKGEDALVVFEKALENAKPSMEVRSKRIGGSVYQIPIEVKIKRQLSLSIRWILEGARKKKGMPMFKRLSGVLLDTFNETGYAFQKKEDAHRMAQANKTFAHLARY